MSEKDRKDGEAKERMDELLRRMLNTPPKPHKPKKDKKKPAK